MSTNTITMAREVTSHRVNGLNEALRLFVLDEPGHGGACHHYVILVPIHETVGEAWLQQQRQGAPRWQVFATAQPDITLVMEGKNAYLQRAQSGKKIELEFFAVTHLTFQNGPIKEHGVGGISHEVLLAVLTDRLEGFQSGQYKCRENALALTKLEEAALWLHKRTMDRLSRNVEGTSQR